jgi:hypothetical protein
MLLTSTNCCCTHPPAGTAFGGLLGGVVGDAAAKLWPLHGRIAVTQVGQPSFLRSAFFLLGWWHDGGHTGCAGAGWRYILSCWQQGTECWHVVDCRLG